ncbi:MAG: MoaD/ThiS family protein [Cyclobacteriaceae bacterium]|nr:MoaD/ThiS family protein [Cyclobacteriaceae bacterium]
MKITLIAFGIAKDILHSKKSEVEIPDGASILSLKQRILHQYPEFSKLKSLSFAVGENYQEDSYQLNENDEVVIIPPVSGG